MADLSQEPAALADIVLSAQTVRVFDGGLYAGAPLESEPVLTIGAGTDLAELVELIAVSAVTDGLCMCLGDFVLEFLSGDKRLAIVAVHHTTSLRWSTWDGDAQLVDGRALARWLAARGYRTPLEHAEATEALQSRGAADEDAWRLAAPPSVLPLMRSLLRTSRTGFIPEELIAEVEGRLSAHEPNALVRCRELLAWYGSGTGRCSGFPTHEDIPGRILARVPIATLIESLIGEPTDGPVWRGALRHLAGWRTRTDERLREVSPTLWDKLEALAAERRDSDTLSRLTRNRARVGN